jgi:hypothetical protein
MPTITREVVFTAEQQDQYLSLPFEMAPGIARLEVSYSIEPLGPGECTVDLGVAACGALRGWSGSERKSFFIAAAKATPGYTPGPLTPGSWEVLLGTYRLPPAGARVVLQIATEPVRRRWLCGDLHHHTHHSDGEHSVAEVMQLAEQAGLDFLALTDHNTITQNSVAGESPVLAIPGLEVTNNHGHLNVLGATEVIDYRFRFASAAENLAEPIRRVHAAGGLVVVNHPWCDYCPWERDLAFDWDLLEVWNGIWTGRNQRALDWWQAQLSAGQRIPVVGGSDTHSVRPLSVLRTGTPTTYTYADDLTVPAILAALKAGRSHISDMPGGPVAWLTASAVSGGAGEAVPGEAVLGEAVLGEAVLGEAVPGEAVSCGRQTVRVRVEHGEQCQLRLMGPHGLLAAWDVPEGQEALEVEWPWEAAPGGFIRAEVWSNLVGWLRALTNPIYAGAGMSRSTAE